MNYSNNNSQYNYTNNYKNQNYYNIKNQNDLNAMYRTDSNYSNINKTPKMVYEEDYTKLKKKNIGNKKRVKFNEDVQVIKVQSYKEYNKIEDVDININDFFVGDGNRQNNIKKRKKGDKCECNLI